MFPIIMKMPISVLKVVPSDVLEEYLLFHIRKHIGVYSSLLDTYIHILFILLYNSGCITKRTLVRRGIDWRNIPNSIIFDEVYQWAHLRLLHYIGSYELSLYQLRYILQLLYSENKYSLIFEILANSDTLYNYGLRIYKITQIEIQILSVVYSFLINYDITEITEIHLWYILSDRFTLNQKHIFHLIEYSKLSTRNKENILDTLFDYEFYTTISKIANFNLTDKMRHIPDIYLPLFELSEIACKGNISDYLVKFVNPTQYYISNTCVHPNTICYSEIVQSNINLDNYYLEDFLDVNLYSIVSPKVRDIYNIIQGPSSNIDIRRNMYISNVGNINTKKCDFINSLKNIYLVRLVVLTLDDLPIINELVKIITSINSNIDIIVSVC